VPRILLITCLVLLLAASAQAAGDPDKGRALATSWCVSCHDVSPGTARTDAAPSFPTLAKQRSPEALKGWLSAPHPPMPNLSLSRAEIDDIVAYLTSLR
jgi:mono/diheme cytochrome c family protein